PPPLPPFFFSTVTLISFSLSPTFTLTVCSFGSASSAAEMVTLASLPSPLKPLPSTPAVTLSWELVAVTSWSFRPGPSRVTFRSFDSPCLRTSVVKEKLYVIVFDAGVLGVPFLQPVAPTPRVNASPRTSRPLRSCFTVRPSFQKVSTGGSLRQFPPLAGHLV